MEAEEEVWLVVDTEASRRLTFKFYTSETLQRTRPLYGTAVRRGARLQVVFWLRKETQGACSMFLTVHNVTHT